MKNLKCWFEPYTLIFRKPAGTSRGVLLTKKTYFIYLQQEEQTFVGEANLFQNLSFDDIFGYENYLRQACQQIENQSFEWEEWRRLPSIQFAAEQILIQQKNQKNILFNSEFVKGEKGIPINGLIWMSSPEEMQRQIEEKLKQRFHCIKLKIGVHWEKEKQILQSLRDKFSAEKLELRVDANGAFNLEEAKEVLKFLKALEIHSIEQPIRQGLKTEMEKLCAMGECAVALDEELIGITGKTEKQSLLQEIKPQFIILKPALVGGFQGSLEWIDLAKKNNIGWWITSALESNIGLNAIAQFTASLDTAIPQGLGTGGLFTNNIESDLEIRGEKLYKKC